MESLTFLERPPKEPQPIYVLHGDQSFLKRQSQSLLRRLVLGPEDDGLALSTHEGDKATRASVLEDLQTLPFLSPRRLVIVESADPFVSRERPWLEKFFVECAGKHTHKGVLVLDVKTWAKTTKLAKVTPDNWMITCDGPKPQLLPQWCVAWSARLGKPMTPRAANLLVNLVGPEMGQLDQEMQKLATFVGDAPQIDVRDVDQLVGNSRTELTWELFDLIGSGQSDKAMTFLARLLHQGEHPMALLGAFRSQLGRLAATARLSGQKLPLKDALTRAGVPTFPKVRESAERLIQHLGQRRLNRIYDWLLEVDMGIKGSSALPAETLVERLVVRLARAKS